MSKNNKAITSFNLSNLKALDTEINSALAVIAKKYNIELGTGRVSYNRDGSSFVTKLTGVVPVFASHSKDDDAKPAIAGKAEWHRDFLNQCILYGLKKEDLGRSIVMNGKSFVIVGLRPRARNNMIILQKSDGNFCVTSNVPVISAIKLAEAKPERKPRTPRNPPADVKPAETTRKPRTPRTPAAQVETTGRKPRTPRAPKVEAVAETTGRKPRTPRGEKVEAVQPERKPRTPRTPRAAAPVTTERKPRSPRGVKVTAPVETGRKPRTPRAARA